MCTHTAQSSVLSNLIFNWHFIVLLIIFQFHDYTLHTQPAQRSTHFELVYYFFQFYSSKDFLWFSFLASKLYCTYCSLCCVVLNRKLCRSKTIFVCCLFLCSVFSHFVLSLSKNCKAVLHSLKRPLSQSEFTWQMALNAGFVWLSIPSKNNKVSFLSPVSLSICLCPPLLSLWANGLVVKF